MFKRNTDCPYCEGHVDYDETGNSEPRCSKCYREPEPFTGLTAKDVRQIVESVVERMLTR